MDHVKRTAENGTLVHDLPLAIDQTLVDNGLKGQLGAPALNTVLHRLSVLSKAHQRRDVPNPACDPAVQELVRRIRRAYAARGVHTTSKGALTKDPLEAMLATCTDGLIGIRDRALLLFAFSSGGRRRSEVAGAVMENLVKVDAETYLEPEHRQQRFLTFRRNTRHSSSMDSWLDRRQRTRCVAKGSGRCTVSTKKTASHSLTIAEARLASNFLDWQPALLEHEPGGLEPQVFNCFRRRKAGLFSEHSTARALTIRAPINDGAAAARAPYAPTPTAQISMTATAPDPTATPIRRASQSSTTCRTAGRPTPLTHCTPSRSAYTVTVNRES